MKNFILLIVILATIFKPASSRGQKMLSSEVFSIGGQYHQPIDLGDDFRYEMDRSTDGLFGSITIYYKDSILPYEYSTLFERFFLQDIKHSDETIQLHFHLASIYRYFYMGYLIIHIDKRKNQPEVNS
jgi:hypothetical protein